MELTELGLRVVSVDIGVYDTGGQLKVILEKYLSIQSCRATCVFFTGEPFISILLDRRWPAGLHPKEVLLQEDLQHKKKGNRASSQQ